MNLFNLSLKLKGFPIHKAKLALEKIKVLSPKEKTQYILDKRTEIVTHHLQHNPFYKKFAAHANVKDWNSIPVLTKRDLQQPLNNTSGSSGYPLSFAKDQFSHALSWAVFMDRYRWHDLDLNSSKQARF